MPDGKLVGLLGVAAQRDFKKTLDQLQVELDAGIWRRMLRVRVVRPEDLLVLDFSFDNLEVRTQGGRKVLSRRTGSQPARLIAQYPPQSMGEGVYQEEPFETGPHGPFTAPSRFAGPSRVAVNMPVEVQVLDWSLEAFLRALSEWPLALDYAARPDNRVPFGLLDVPPGRGLADHLGDLSRHLQEKSGVSLADVQSLKRSAARLGGAVLAGARGGQADDTRIGALFESELRRTLISKPRRAAAETTAAQQILVLATAERLVREATAVGAAEAGLEIIDSIFPVLGIPHPPAATVTAIEAPWRVIQSPLASAGFAHARLPVAHEGRTELWHSRLGRREAGGINDRVSQPLRAIWSPDYGDRPQEQSFASPSTAEDRNFLVRATAGYNGVNDGWPTPRPGDARQLILSALGARLDYYGVWSVNDKLPLESWTHQAALGRDFYVRIVKAGFLFPFGHKAVYVALTERKFEDTPDGKARNATLRQKHFIIVREPIRTYPSAGMLSDGRGLPFRSVEILTKETPPLAKPPPNQPNWWPVRSSTDFLFDCVGVDHAGQKIAFTAPLAFIRTDANGPHAPTYVSIRDAYNSGGDGRAKRPLSGARVAFAPPAVDDPDAGGDTRIPTETITFQGLDAQVSGQAPRFYPNMKAADVVVGALQALTGARKTANVSFPQVYRDNGVQGANIGQIFLEAQAQPLKFGEGGPGADTVGGLVTPNMTPSAFSRRFGVVGGQMAAFAGGRFDPGAVFGDAKLLGVLPLRDILRVIENVATEPGQTPKFTQVEAPDRVVSELHLTQTGLKSALVFEPNVGGTSVLDVRARTTVILAGGAPQTDVQGSLTWFRINLFGFISLNFDRLRFFAEPGRKPEVDVDLDPDNGVVFGGPLRFVNTLRDVIPSNGFSDPPDLAISPSGITASYSLSLPTIGVGVFSLQNVSLGAGFTLPFTGESPSVRFNFAERHNPFNLTVSLFGGGGFFLIGIDAGGVREIEAALEFGAQISINLGVAAGRVYVKAGVYFHWQEAPDKLVELEGYVEMGGELSVLGLISVSLTFHLSLGYRKTGGRAEVRGQAQLVVEVEVLFFSASVKVKVERSFAGAPADPIFLQFVPSDDAWREYCAAFA